MNLTCSTVHWLCEWFL